MLESNDELNQFMRFWFSGLISGLESVDAPAREAILRECGKACASSYTAGVFKEAKKNSADMESFLAALAERFPGATYELVAAEPVGAETITVRYPNCACDLVESGLVKSPLLCDCSAHNLRENFEQTLNRPVTVSLVSSILQGASRCEFLVSTAD
jgi:predicted hydrocarbon binding protein